MIEPAPLPIPRHTRAVIIGAGHGGLAMAYALLRKGLHPQRDFVLIDEGDADTALDREPVPPSTVRQAALPGIRPAGTPQRPMSTGETVSYRHSYANQLGVKPVWDTRVSAIRVDPHGHGLHVVTDRGDIATRNVIITGVLPVELTGDGRSWASQLGAHHAERQIPGMFVIPSGTATRLRGLRADTARAARMIARRP